MNMKKIFIIIFCVVLCIASSACNDGTVTPGTENSSQSSDQNGGLESESGKKVSFMLPVFDYSDSTKWENKVLADFKEEYPEVELQTISAAIDNWMIKLRSSASSGEPVDVFQDSANNNPMYALQGINQALNNYIDLDNPDLDMVTMDSIFKYHGNYHVATAGSSVCVIYYNKDIFEEEGINDPMTYYEAGNWNFDTLAQVAKQLTYNDSTGKRFGFTCNYPYIFFGANKTSMVKLTDDYKYELNIQDPNLALSLQVIQDAWYTSKWQGWDASPWSVFYNGTAAMLADFQWVEAQILEARNHGLADFEYGVVPMASGPNNPEGLSNVTAFGYAMGNGSDAPYHSGKLIDMLISGEAADDAELNKVIPEEHLAIYSELAQKPFCVNSFDSAVGGAFEIAQAIAVGQSIAQAIAEFTPIYQQKVDEANGSTISGG
ncbi:MAG: ABC transporter substrate-binding protein [Saccharofermentanales bacterium]